VDGLKGENDQGVRDAYMVAAGCSQASLCAGLASNTELDHTLLGWDWTCHVVASVSADVFALCGRHTAECFQLGPQIRCHSPRITRPMSADIGDSVTGGLEKDSRWPTAILVAHNVYSSIALPELGNYQRFTSIHPPTSYSKTSSL
jgi:hypothetical protein